MNNTEKIIEKIWTSSDDLNVLIPKKNNKEIIELIKNKLILAIQEAQKQAHKHAKPDCSLCLSMWKNGKEEGEKQAIEEIKQLTKVNTQLIAEKEDIRKQTAEQIFKDLGKIVIDVHIDYNLQFDRKSFEELKEKYLGENK